MPSPQEIVASALPGKAVVGWKLRDSDRAELLERFPPLYPKTVADHVTLSANVSSSTAVPPDTDATVCARVTDHTGVEALIVAIEGSSDRPGGGTFHITWSLADGRRPKESNDVLATHGWDEVDPHTIRLKGSRIR